MFQPREETMYQMYPARGKQAVARAVEHARVGGVDARTLHGCGSLTKRHSIVEDNRADEVHARVEAEAEGGE